MGMRRIEFFQGQIYHIYNRGNRKKSIFYRERDYEVFLGLVRKYSHRFKVKVIAYCLLPNHFHFALKPLMDGSIPKFMQGMGISYTIYINRRNRLVGHVFQGRYQAKHVPVHTDWKRLRAYLQNNPVKLKLVTKYYDYRWLRVHARPLWL